MKIADLFAIHPTFFAPPRSGDYKSKLELYKMGSKPLRDLFEEAAEEAEKIFGDDTKL